MHRKQDTHNHAKTDTHTDPDTAYLFRSLVDAQEEVIVLRLEARVERVALRLLPQLLKTNTSVRTTVNQNFTTVRHRTSLKSATLAQQSKKASPRKRGCSRELTLRHQSPSWQQRSHSWDPMVAWAQLPAHPPARTHTLTPMVIALARGRFALYDDALEKHVAHLPGFASAFLELPHDPPQHFMILPPMTSLPSTEHFRTSASQNALISQLIKTKPWSWHKQG